MTMSRWKRIRLLSVIIAGIASAPAGCGGNNPAGPSSDEDFPRVASNCATGPPSAIYMIMGLSRRVVNPSGAPPLEARMRVGEAAKLRVEFNGCGFNVDQTWITTNPAVGMLEPLLSGDPPGFYDAILSALAPGEVSVFAEFRGPDGGRHRTTTAYCEGEYTGLGSPGACENPKKIGIVRVVP